MIKSAADVRVFLANELPCYTNDSDEDDFIFIVRAEDVERVALKLWRSLTSAAPDTPARVTCAACGNPALLPGWYCPACGLAQPARIGEEQ